MNRKFVSGILSILALLMSVTFLNIVSAEEYSTQAEGGQPSATPLLIEDFTYPVGSL